MRDNNVLVRPHQALPGADVKDAQALMRDARASTTLDIYQQFVPESQRRIVERLTGMVQ